MERDLEKLKERFGVQEIINTQKALELGSTIYFLTKVTNSKLPINYNCYEQNLFNKNLLITELNQWLKIKRKSNYGRH